MQMLSQLRMADDIAVITAIAADYGERHHTTSQMPTDAEQAAATHYAATLRFEGIAAEQWPDTLRGLIRRHAPHKRGRRRTHYGRSGRRYAAITPRAAIIELPMPCQLRICILR